jgi:hypothetical protein
MSDGKQTAHGKRRVPGVLFLFDEPTLPWEVRRAENVAENIAAFSRFSEFPVWGVNTGYGFRPGLRDLEFDAIAVHYSVFVNRPEGYLIDQEFLDHLANASGYKVVFFQDEHQWCGRRFGFVDEFGFDCVYTMLEEPHASEVYGSRTSASKVVSHLPSYVGPSLLKGAKRFAKPDRKRSIDIGYRGRPSPVTWGRGALEKHEIGVRFAELAADCGLRLDIGVSEEDRIYGREWDRFTADLRATLGVESGASCFDLEDEVREEYERLSADGREPTIEELERGALGRWDGRIPYRTVSPRNFEAAAYRVTQILFEGRYSGLLEPMRHYIPLRKDFSNLDEVLERFRDESLRRELTENAHRDLIASGAHGYERLIEGFDAVLREAGLRPEGGGVEAREVKRALRRSLSERRAYWERTRLSWLYQHHPKAWRVAFYVLHPVEFYKLTRVRLGALVRRG